jgi:hypothetical protein
MMEASPFTYLHRSPAVASQPARPGSNKIPIITLKRRIYCSAVISTLTYGHLVLIFDDKVQKRLNGFNARCLATIYIGHRIVPPAVRIQRTKEHSVPLGTTSASGISGKRTYSCMT